MAASSAYGREWIGSAATDVPVVLIPAYKPSEQLIDLCKALIGSGEFASVVAVDDGSGGPFRPIFQELRCLPGITVLQHVTNLGKGAALKTGLNYVACNFERSVGVVTADADGQHAVEDICRVARALHLASTKLILGGRLFDGEVPLLSRIGNSATKYVMRALVGCNVSDTQTGLRGIPMKFVPELLHSKATKYDFELDMLLKWHQEGSRQISEIPIKTIYLDGNKSSHFNPLLDSMRVYFVFLRFASVSLATAAIDGIVFFWTFSASHDVLSSFIVGRAVAAVFNYLANKKEVFRSSVRNTFAIPRYVATLVLSGCVSYLSIKGLILGFGLPVLAAKVLAEGALFFFSFIVQRNFVFSTANPAIEKE